MKASYGSHSEEEGQAFVRPAFPHARPSAATTSRRVAVGTAIAVLSAAAATAAYVAFVEPPETNALQQTPVATQLQASTLLEALMADVGPTAFDALDMDGDGIVTKSEYLGRLTAHRDDVLSKLQHSNLDETVKQPIAEILQETYDHEAACVASVFEMSGGRAVDKATFEFVHPLIASLCKKASTSGGGGGEATTPPQFDMDGNVISSQSVDGAPAAAAVDIDGGVPVATQASTFDDDILAPSTTVLRSGGEASGDDEPSETDASAPPGEGVSTITEAPDNKAADMDTPTSTNSGTNSTASTGDEKPSDDEPPSPQDPATGGGGGDADGDDTNPTDPPTTSNGDQTPTDDDSATTGANVPPTTNAPATSAGDQAPADDDAATTGNDAPPTTDAPPASGGAGDAAGDDANAADDDASPSKDAPPIASGGDENTSDDDSATAVDDSAPSTDIPTTGAGAGESVTDDDSTTTGDDDASPSTNAPPAGGGDDPKAEGDTSKAEDDAAPSTDAPKTDSGDGETTAPTTGGDAIDDGVSDNDTGVDPTASTTNRPANNDVDATNSKGDSIDEDTTPSDESTPLTEASTTTRDSPLASAPTDPASTPTDKGDTGNEQTSSEPAIDNTGNNNDDVISDAPGTEETPSDTPSGNTADETTLPPTGKDIEPSVSSTVDVPSDDSESTPASHDDNKDDEQPAASPTVDIPDSEADKNSQTDEEKTTSPPSEDDDVPSEVSETATTQDRGSEDDNDKTAAAPSHADEPSSATTPKDSTTATTSSPMLPINPTINDATDGAATKEDPVVVKKFLDELDPSRNATSDVDAPQSKSPERVAFEKALAKVFERESEDRAQRVAFANMQVKKNEFVADLIQECVSHAGSRFAFNESYSFAQAVEWIRTKCLVFPDVFKLNKTP